MRIITNYHRLPFFLNKLFMLNHVRSIDLFVDKHEWRYKVYAEGRSWSVSEKYILACDSMTLFIELNNYDFYTRSLVPLQHYWPIRPKHMCTDLKFAVEWGNSHPKQVSLLHLSYNIHPSNFGFQLETRFHTFLFKTHIITAFTYILLKVL